MTSANPANPRSAPDGTSSGMTWLALLVSLVAVGGSLWLTLQMDLKPCPLCYYQRSFAMAAAAVLTVGLLSGAFRSSAVSLLALPCAAAGAGIAGWHVYLEYIGKLECPSGIFDVGTAPQQSLAALAFLFLILLFDAFRVRAIGGSRVAGVFLALIVGAGLTYASFTSVLPKPKPRTTAYDPNTEPLDICRPPYVAPK